MPTTTRYLATVAHPTCPFAAKILALSERQPVTGPECLNGTEAPYRNPAAGRQHPGDPAGEVPGFGVSTQSILGVIGAAVRLGQTEIEFRLCSKSGSLGTLVRQGSCRHEDANYHREIQSGERHASRSRGSVRSDPARRGTSAANSPNPRKSMPTGSAGHAPSSSQTAFIRRVPRQTATSPRNSRRSRQHSRVAIR